MGVWQILGSASFDGGHRSPWTNHAAARHRSLLYDRRHHSVSTAPAETDVPNVRCPPCDPQVVPPPFRVEIRSIEIQVEESTPPGDRARYDVDRGRALRPWPFRWPLKENTPPTRPETPQVALLGNYIDVLV